MHPELISCYVEGSLLLEIKERVDAELREDLDGLRPEEAAVLSLLEARMNRDLATVLKESVAELEKA